MKHIVLLALLLASLSCRSEGVYPTLPPTRTATISAPQKSPTATPLLAETATATATSTAAPTATDTPVPSPTPIIIIVEVTPLTGDIECELYRSGADPVKGMVYTYTDPENTNLRQNIRAKPVDGAIIGSLEKNDPRTVYWEWGDWVALDRACTQWVKKTLGTYEDRGE